MYAIFRAQGKQFRAEPDATLRLPTLDVEPGEQVTFDEVLLAERDGALLIGTPSLAGASVQAEVLGHGRGEKVVVFKMKRRKGYRRKQGHRQGFTEIRVVEIALEAPRPRKPKRPPAELAKGEKAPEPAKAEEAPERPEAEQAPERAVTTEKAPEPPESGSAAPAEITEAARQLAEGHGIDLSTIEGSGKGGRILKGDVERAIKEREGS